MTSRATRFRILLTLLSESPPNSSKWFWSSKNRTGSSRPKHKMRLDRRESAAPCARCAAAILTAFVQRQSCPRTSSLDTIELCDRNREHVTIDQYHIGALTGRERGDLVELIQCVSVRLSSDLAHDQRDATAQPQRGAPRQERADWEGSKPPRSNQPTVLGRLGESSITGATTCQAVKASRPSTALLICSEPFFESVT